MKKIIDLNGTYSSAEIENKWVGRVLLDSNNYFEGFIENYYYNEISYVFGYLDSENFKMIVCSKDNNEMPKKYNKRLNINSPDNAQEKKNKLSEILDEDYVTQLKGYQHYIESITSKNVYTYLYSILSSNLKKIS